MAGSAAGISLGFVGGFVSGHTRIGVASMAAVLAVILGLCELFKSRPLRPLQLDRETPQRWRFSHVLVWSAKNGMALGFGATTRIGFWLWYAVPLAAFVAGSAWLGAAIYGAYASARGLSVWVLAIVAVLGRRSCHSGPDDIAMWLTGREDRARLMAGGTLVSLGVCIVIGVAI
jgi:hypothetical protein